MLKTIKILLVVVCYLAIQPTLKAQSLSSFFEKTQTFLETNIKEGKVPYAQLKESPEAVTDLVDQIAKMDLEGTSDVEKKAFYINAYNILVIKTVLDHYPIQTPNDVAGFFDRVKHTVAGKKQTLNTLEKKELLQTYKDGRFHFVLVCAAVSCPPIANFAYTPEKLEQQLTQQTKLAMDNPQFIQVHEFSENVEISEIFKWYVDDFKPSVKEFINQYKTEALPKNYGLTYYNYDWRLNDSSPESNGDKNFVPIISSLAMPKGKFEIKLFNNLFSATYGTGIEDIRTRSSYFSSFLNLSYGLNGRIDLGLDFILKSNVLNDLRKNTAFKVFEFKKGNTDNTVSIADSNYTFTSSANWGLSHLGPRIRFVPFRKLSDFSIEQAFYFPIQREVDGTFIWVTQFYYNIFLNPKLGLFLAATIWQPFKFTEKVYWNPPFIKAFLSWYPNKRFTVYATTTNLLEWGGGAKVLITPGLEVELLYTHYLPFEFVNNWVGKNAMTFNLGLRYRI
ncbi:MAG: DUF547 domain-containing protein [Aureispira sp.]|nr:DUF547 domain-containing protein [Aureispira sp.]